MRIRLRKAGEETLKKGRVRAHTRVVNGKPVQVREHDSGRPDGKQNEPAPEVAYPGVTVTWGDEQFPLAQHNGLQPPRPPFPDATVLGQGLHTGTVWEHEGKAWKRAVHRVRMLDKGPDGENLFAVHEYRNDDAVAAIQAVADLPRVPSGIEVRDGGDVLYIGHTACKTPEAVGEKYFWSGMERGDIEEIEETLRLAAERGVQVNDTLQLGYDPERSDVVVMDWSNAHIEKPFAGRWPDGYIEQVTELYRKVGDETTAVARELAKDVRRDAWDREMADGTKTERRYVYGSFHRPAWLGMLGTITDMDPDSNPRIMPKPESQGDQNRDLWLPHDYVVSATPLSAGTCAQLELTPLHVPPAKPAKLEKGINPMPTHLLKSAGEQKVRVRAHPRKTKSGVTTVHEHPATRQKAAPKKETVRNSAKLPPRVFERLNKLIESGQAEVTKDGTKWVARAKPDGKTRFRSLGSFKTQGEALQALVREFGITSSGSMDKTYKDVGEKIGGARKDTSIVVAIFSDTPTEKNLLKLEKQDPDAAKRAVVKKTIWPEPDFSDKPVVFALGAKMVYSCIPASPNTNDPAQRMDYFHAVDMVQRLVMTATTPGELLGRLKGLQEEIATAAKEQRDRKYNKNIPPATEYQIQLARYAVMMPELMKWLVEGKPKRKYSLWQWQDSVKVHSGEAKFFRYRDGEREQVPAEEMRAYYEDVDRRKYEQLFGAQEARRPAHRAEKPEAIRWERSVADEYERKGGKKVAIRRPEDYIKAFGLRGVEFGNWMDHDSSREHVDRCAEAFHDLADMLGIPSHQLSVNGRLALAFGARGGGKAAAHYEPGKVVINLTKTGGAGTLAHEWAHFLDHAIALVEMGNGDFATGQGTGTNPTEVLEAKQAVMRAIWNGTGSVFMEATPGHKVTHDWLEMDIYLKRNNNDAQATIDDLQKRYRVNQSAVDYVCAKTKAKGVRVNSKESKFLLDSMRQQGSKNGYWTRPHELFARAFESYIHEKLRAKRRKSSYLARECWEKFGREHGWAPYPLGEERDHINAAFDKLFDAIRKTGMMQKALGIFGRLLKSTQKVRVRTRTLNKRTGPVVQPAHTETRKTGSKIAAAVQQAEPAAHEQVYEIPLSQIQPDPHQHRKTFPADTMRELADSIKETGGNRTPIVVRRVEGPGKVQFQIIAGERRYRALKQNKMPVARAVIRENVTDEDALLEQVIENLNRLNVTPTEEATAYRQLADGEIARAKRRKEWRGADLKDIAAQEKLEALGRNYAAAKSGKQKSRVDYYIVLTDLPEEARDMVDKGHLTTAHAHALLRLTDYKEDSRNLDPKFRKERVLHLVRMARHARANSSISAKILNGMVTEYIRANQQQTMFSDDEVTGGEKQVRRQAQKAKLAKLLDAVVSAIGQSWDDDTQEFQADAMSAADLQLAMGQIDGAMDSFGKIKDVYYREMLAREAQEATKRRVVREDAAEDGASSPQPRGLSLFKAILATLRGNHG